MPSSPTPRGERRRTPRGTLSPGRIVSAAIAVIDTEGVDALTTRRLAEDLGVRPMALYTHFRDKDAILRAAGEELLGRFAMPEDTSGDLALLRALVREHFRLLIDNPDLLALIAYVDEVAPSRMRILDPIHGCLLRLGLDRRAAVGVAAVLVRFVFGCAAVYPARRAWDDEPGHWTEFGRRLAVLPPAAYPAMHELSRDFPAFTQQELFEFGLETLLGTVVSPVAGAPRTAGS